MESKEWCALEVDRNGKVICVMSYVVFILARQKRQCRLCEKNVEGKGTLYPT